MGLPCGITVPGFGLVPSNGVLVIYGGECGTGTARASVTESARALAVTRQIAS